MLMFYYLKKYNFYFGIILLSLTSTTVNASLIDDVVFVRQGYDDSSGMVYRDELVPASFPIVAVGPILEGNSDEVSINPNYDTAISIDVDSSSFSLIFHDIATSWGPGYVFNGYVISDFNYEPDWVISGFSLQNNLVNWDATSIPFAEDRISFTNDMVFLDFTGLSFMATGDLSVQLSFSPSPVPLPPSLWLFVSGLIGIIGVSRKKYKHAI